MLDKWKHCDHNNLCLKRHVTSTVVLYCIGVIVFDLYGLHQLTKKNEINKYHSRKINILLIARYISLSTTSILISFKHLKQLIISSDVNELNVH